jgi:hypothetical protein
MEENMARIKTPIKSCNVCWRNYTLSEWELLELKAERGPFEDRECAQCCTLLTIDRTGLDELDLTDDADDYRAVHPGTARDPLPVAEPVKASAVAPLTKATTEIKRSPTSPQAVVQTWLHRTAPQIQESVKLWIAHLPTDADAFTLGELRALFRSGWR